LLHAKQFFGSVIRSAQPVLQKVFSGGQETQLLLMHVKWSVPEQTLAQTPQLAESDEGSVHFPLQQSCPSVQKVPHAPQFFRSDARFVVVPKQTV
jgi:hypothetical protein